jgi:hypothetical protein
MGEGGGVELHRHWVVRLYGPLWILAAVGCFLGPTLILPALDYEFFVGNWIAYPAGVVLLLIGAYYIRDQSRPYLLRVDRTGVVWRQSGKHGAVPWHDVVRIGLEKKPDEPPRAKPRHLTVWLRHPLPAAGDPDVRLNGLVGYRLASVRELVESAEEINTELRRHTPGVAGGPAVPSAAAFAGQFGGGPGVGGPGDGGPFGGGPLGVAPAAYGAPRAPMEGECAECGGSPAAYVVLQSIVSVAIFHSARAYRGWLCRHCALATYRQLSARTLLGCWWGVGILGGPIVLLANRLRMRPALRLGPPRPTPGVTAPSPGPLDPGPRLLGRPAGIVGLIVGLVLSLLVAFVIVSVFLSA